LVGNYNAWFYEPGVFTDKVLSLILTWTLMGFLDFCRLVVTFNLMFLDAFIFKVYFLLKISKYKGCFMMKNKKEKVQVGKF